MSKIKTAMRIFLGLVYFVFGINFFLHFIPMPAPEPGSFGAALFATGYMFQFIKITEIICGALLLANAFVPLVLVIIAPVTLNIFMLHLMMDPSGLPMAIALLVLNAGLGYMYLNAYKPMLKMK